jgi:hypothetical protein
MDKKVRNVCDTDDDLQFGESFTWSNTSDEDCTIAPNDDSVFPFVGGQFTVHKKSTHPGKTLSQPPLSKHQKKYTYDVTGGGCGGKTMPKNVLVPASH